MTRPIRTLAPSTVSHILNNIYDRKVIRDVLEAYGGLCPECAGCRYVTCGLGDLATKPCPCCVLEEDGEIGCD